MFSCSNGKPIEDASEAVVYHYADSNDVKNGPIDSETIESETIEVIDSEVNFEEVGNHFEGDMQMTPGEIRQLFAKTGLVNTRYRWVKVGGLVVVPYTLQVGIFSKNSLNKHIIII